MDLFNYQNQNIKNHFQRSIRIDNELSKEFLDHFIFHATGKKVLNQITSSINNSNQCAFTLTGPYGTGKSSLALFLQALLSNNNKIRDFGERGVPNILFFLNGEDAVTNSNGEFEFSAIHSGKYTLDYDFSTLPVNYQFTELISRPVEVIEGRKQYVEIPLTVLGKVSGYLFLDENKNNVLDKNEIIIKDIQIILEDRFGEKFETKSDANGFYEFSNLKSGLYNLIINPDFLPKRTVKTFSDESLLLFSDSGWPIHIKFKNPEINFDLPVYNEEVPIQWDIMPQKNTEESDSLKSE